MHERVPSTRSFLLYVQCTGNEIGRFAGSPVDVDFDFECRVSGSSQREEPAAQSDINCLKVSWNKEAIKLGARRPNSRSKVCTSPPYMHRYKAQESQCQPWTRASFRSGWATAVPHVVGERHHGRRFAELPPSF